MKKKQVHDFNLEKLLYHSNNQMSTIIDVLELTQSWAMSLLLLIHLKYILFYGKVFTPAIQCLQKFYKHTI